MKNHVIYTAVSGIDEGYLADTEKLPEIQAEFRRERKRKSAAAIGVCVCLIVIAAVWTGARRLPGKTPSALPDETVPADPPPVQTEPAGSEPGPVPPETASAAPPVQTTDTPSVGGGEKPVQATEAPSSEAPASDDGSVIWADGDTGAVGSAIVGWNGKQIDYALWSVLQEGIGDRTLAITASPRPDGGAVYNGKTLVEYEEDAEAERLLPEKLRELLKTGEALKYGPALYETGTPEGERWDKALYEEKVAYFGEALLSRYIVDGIFLADRVQNDVAAAEAAHTAQNACEEAYAACVRELRATAAAAWSAQGFSCETDSGRLLLFARADEFAGLIPTPGCEWSFALARRDEGTVAPA